MSELLHIVPLDAVDSVVNENREQLETLLRYDRYRVAVHESPEMWVATLGPDVLSLTHPAVTAAITLRFADHNEAHGLPLSDEERIMLFTTPWIHDWGELKINGEGVGDVTYSLRTAADEEVESTIFHRIVETVGDEAARELFTRAYNEVAMDRTSKLGRMFHAVEQIGYLTTAIRAFRGWEGKRIENWRGLAGNVLSHQVEKLLALAPSYPYVNHILNSNEAVISHMFDEIAGQHRIPSDAQGIPLYDREKFLHAYDVWVERDGSVVLYRNDQATV